MSLQRVANRRTTHAGHHLDILHYTHEDNELRRRVRSFVVLTKPSNARASPETNRRLLHNRIRKGSPRDDGTCATHAYIAA